MIWAAMKSNGAICLRRCPPRVNAVEYRNILQGAKSFIKPGYAALWTPEYLLPLRPIVQGSWLDISARWSAGASGNQHILVVALQAGGSSQCWSLAADVSGHEPDRTSVALGSEAS